MHETKAERVLRLLGERRQGKPCVAQAMDAGRAGLELLREFVGEQRPGVPMIAGCGCWHCRATALLERAD